MSAKWPSPQDFNEAIQSPHQCFRDDRLRKGTVETNALGLPRVESGNFANVYKVRCSDGEWAVRCFTHRVPDSEARYHLLSDFILHDNLIYTVTFDFQKEGIKVGKGIYPIVKMEWVHGDHILPWIDKHIEEPQAITRLAERFLHMMHELQTAGIAHGDLQHGNIIIVDDDFRLIDYDGMFVPAMNGMPSNELGHPNFQHPLRDKMHFGAYLDNFSAWLIYSSLQIIARDPSLWKDIGRENGETILFTKSDLQSPEQSPTFSMLHRHKNDDIKKAAASILELLALTPEQVPPPTVARDHLVLRPVKRRSVVDKLIGRAGHIFKKRPKPRMQTFIPPSHVPSQPVQPQIKPTADWIKDWIVQNPVEVAKPAPTTQSKPAEPPLGPPLTHGAKDDAGEDIKGPYRLRQYEIARLLDEAKGYTEVGRFHDAKVSLGAAQDAIRSGSSPKMVLEVLRTEAVVTAATARSNAEVHRYHEALTMYEKASKIMNLLKQMQNGKPNINDDLAHSEYLEALAAIYKELGKLPLAQRAYNDAIGILSAHPQAKRELNRIRKQLGLGIT